MRSASVAFRTLLLTIAIGFAQAGSTSGIGAATGSPIRLDVGPSDRAAAASASGFRYHILRARTEAARGVALSGPSPLSFASIATVRPAPEAALARVPRPGFYPADLSDVFGGNVVKRAVFNNVYVGAGCGDGSCWGDPTTFQRDLGKSKFIHLVDQYVGSKANGRYSSGTQFSTDLSACTSATFCSISDILAIVHLAAADTAHGGGSGYGHIINVFLPQGTDTCKDIKNTICYSPDNPQTFAFCGYHSSVVFNEPVGETIFTVEPFQNVPGCAVALPSPNGQLADSTNATLSHETFETITDPDVPFSWVAVSSANEFDAEIGDECDGLADLSGDEIVPTFAIGGAPFKVAMEYSNRYHACANVP